jgi:uncharacterized protein (DUF1499 family)
VVLTLDSSAAFQRAQEAVDALGWEVVTVEPQSGILEATETTAFFGFEDDVVIRVRSGEPGTSRIDVRSKSRVGRSDVGANAARIRRFVAALE